VERPGTLPLRALREAQSLREEIAGATLAAAISRYVSIQATKPRGWRPSTTKTMRIAYRQLLAAVGDRPVKSLTMDDTDSAMLAAYSGGYSPQWVEYLRCVWGAFCRWLVRQRALISDISISWEPVPKDPDDHRRVFHDYSPEELTLLCRHMMPKYGRLCWIACYAGGLREQNLLDLTWRKIHEDSSGRWTIVVPGSEMKGGRELRWPVTASLRAILGPRGAPDEKVIPGLPRSRSKIWEMLKKGSRRAGLPPEWAYVHQFRRTCCAWLKRAGVTRDEAMRLFGWRSEDTMLNHYWPRETDDERRAILDKML
jgi:hypothetical protein